MQTLCKRIRGAPALTFNPRIDSNTKGQQYKNFKLRLEVGKCSFSFQVADPWNSFPNQLIKVPKVKTFEKGMDRYWRGHSQLYDFRAKK